MTQPHRPLENSLKLCWPDGADFAPETVPYAVSLLAKLGRRPDPSYSVSPVYRRHWAEVETGKILGKDVASAASALEGEIRRLEENRALWPQIKAELEADFERRLEANPRYQALQKELADLQNRIALTAGNPTQEAAE